VKAQVQENRALNMDDANSGSAWLIGISCSYQIKSIKEVAADSATGIEL
jgi:hypothetical protein